MGLFRSSTPPGPPPSAPKPTPSSVVYEPATVDACKADYATGKQARKNLGKPAE